MSDEAASRLSSKLLQGWCMLDQSCDKCYTPIMRDKEKNDYCCGCQAYINKKPIEPQPLPSIHTSSPSQASEKLEFLILKLSDDLLASSSLEVSYKISEIIEKLASAHQSLTKHS